MVMFTTQKQVSMQKKKTILEQNEKKKQAKYMLNN